MGIGTSLLQRRRPVTSRARHVGTDSDSQPGVRRRTGRVGAILSADPKCPRGSTRPRPAFPTQAQGGAHEGRCRQGDRARRTACRPGTRSARQAHGGRARDPRRARRRCRLVHPRRARIEEAGATIVSTDDLYKDADAILRVAEAVRRRGQAAAQGPGAARPAAAAASTRRPPSPSPSVA